jgi:hypothetical protein
LFAAAVESGEFFRDAVLNLVVMPKMCAQLACFYLTFASCAPEFFSGSQ